jgi:hypothetical protein
MLSLQFPVSFSPRNNQFDSFFRLTIVSKMWSAYINHLSEIPFQEEVSDSTGLPHQKSHLHIL